MEADNTATNPINANNTENRNLPDANLNEPEKATNKQNAETNNEQIAEEVTTTNNNNRQLPNIEPNQTENANPSTLPEDLSESSQTLTEEPKQENKALTVLKNMGRGIYNGLYAAGGFFSELFGITTPRYAYALREYERRQERIRQQEREREAAADAMNDPEDPNYVKNDDE